MIVPATQESPVFRLEDEVHDIRDDVPRLATRLDGLEERFERKFRRIEERMDKGDGRMHRQFDHMKEWCQGVAENLERTDHNRKGMEALQHTILAQLAEIRRGEQPAGERKTLK